MRPYEVPFGRRFAGAVRLPSSKSVTNRALNLALLGGSPISLGRPLVADDTEAFVAALRTLGLDARKVQGGLRLEPGDRPAAAALDCGASGTMARFLAATLSALEGDWRLDGSPRLRERPLAPLLESLRGLGAEIRCPEREGFLPLSIRGGTLEGGHVRIDAGASSQYLSALLMAATRARAAVTLTVDGLTSAPYVEVTLDALRGFGARVDRLGEGFRIEPGLTVPHHFAIEGDLSAAGYFAAAAAITAGRIEIEGARRDSPQGDLRFLELLQEMGAAVDWPQSNRVIVSGTDLLRSVDADMSDLPDQVPTLAAIAPFAAGTTRIRNVAHLRIKESDRLAACARELRRLGAEVEQEPASLTIAGLWHQQVPPGEPVEVATYDDHRIAMSFAVAGLRRPRLAITDPAVVGKSYPAFWEDFERCLMG